MLPLKIVFMGTPEFAVPSLKMLVEEGYDVATVVTQPDKPKGRGNKLSMPPVKEFALSSGIRVVQPDKVKTSEFLEELKLIRPDLLITVAYGKLLSQGILDIPPLGCINVHASILPAYRGAAPINWAIINGEKETGITTMYTDIGMDTGDMLLKSTVKITDSMGAGELHDKLSVLGAQVLKDTIIKLKDNTLIRIPQTENIATYAPMMKKETGKIDWDTSAVKINNLVRGTNPWPGAFTFYKCERIKVWKTEILNKESSGSVMPGTVLDVSKSGIVVATASGSIKIVELQTDSCRKMNVDEYICGHNIEKGEVLGG